MKVIRITALVAILLFTAGCATYVVRDGNGNIIEQGTAGGFGRDIVHTKSVSTTTTVVNGIPVTQTNSVDSISSTSNVANVLTAANQILGTAVDAAGKLKP